jgi:hypothetical protein
MVYGSCVILEAFPPITNVLRSQKKWELRKIISESTQPLPTELLRYVEIWFFYIKVGNKGCV